MRHDRHSRRRQQRIGHAGDDAKREHELPIRGALRHDEQARDPGHGAREEEPARAPAVEHGPDLHAQEERQEDVDAADPADLRGRVGRELVRHPVRLEDADGGLEAERPRDDAEGAGDYEPRFQPAFGEGVLRWERGLLCFERGLTVLGSGDLGEWEGGYG